MNLKRVFAILAVVGAVGAALGGAYRLGWSARDADWTAAKTASELMGQQTELRADRAVQPHAERRAAAKPIFAYIDREVPSYVTPEMDRSFPLSRGFVRLHDAAAQAVLPAPPSLDDAEISPIAGSDAIRTIAGNYGACHDAMTKLDAFQLWAHEISGAQILPESGGGETPPL